MDVLSILIPLLETRQLFIPGRGEQIPAKNGFQMFATQTIGHTMRSHNGEKKLFHFLNFLSIVAKQLVDEGIY
jgi:midasin (ATPase involved in ribosome maturation)